MYLHAYKHIKWVVDQGKCNLGLEVITSNFMLVYCTNEAACMRAYIYIVKLDKRCTIIGALRNDDRINGGQINQRPT